MTLNQNPALFGSLAPFFARVGNFLILRGALLLACVFLVCAGVAQGALVGPITFATDAEYDSNFKEGTAGASMGRDPGGFVRVQSPAAGTTIGAAAYDSGATGGSAGAGGTGGPDTNNDLLNVSISASVSTSNRNGTNAVAGFLFRLDSNEANGYLATVTITTSGVVFSVYEGVGINTTSLPTSSFSLSSNPTTAPNTFFPFKVTLSGDTFTFDFNNGAATASFTDPTPTATSAGQVGFWLRSPQANGNTNLDNFEIDAVPEPGTLAILISGFGMLAFQRRRKAQVDPRAIRESHR